MDFREFIRTLWECQKVILFFIFIFNVILVWLGGIALAVSHARFHRNCTQSQSLYLSTLRISFLVSVHMFQWYLTHSICLKLLFIQSSSRITMSHLYHSDLYLSQGVKRVKSGFVVFMQLSLLILQHPSHVKLLFQRNRKTQKDIKQMNNNI